MEKILHHTFQRDPQVVNSVFELRRDVATKLLSVVSLVYLVWHMANTVVFPLHNLWIVWAVSLIYLPACFATYLLLNRRYLLAQLVWHTAAFLCILVAAVQFQDVRIYFLLGFLPFSAVMLINFRAGLVAEFIIFLLVWGVDAPRGWMLPILPIRDGQVILFLGGAFGLVGWAIADAMLTVGEWYTSSFLRAQNSMEEIRQQRVQLAKVIKNLDQAYYRLQRTNADLVAAWKVAAEAERIKTEFATHISHELRTPLNLIAGFSEMMMTSPENYGKAPLPGPYRRDLNTIYRSARHLLDLVDDVIDLARINAGRLSISREEVDMNHLVQEAVVMVRSYIEAKGLKFNVEVQTRLPRLQLDRLRIRQVLLNLLVNATRFTEHGSISLKVGYEESFVRVNVTDTGRGIRSEEMETLFSEFNPGEKPRDGGVPWHSGSGLGLPISKKFIDLHRGHMGVESELGRGTTIWFELPVAEIDALEADGNLLGEDLPEMPIFLTERDVAHQEGQRLALLVHSDRRLPGFLQRHLAGWRVQGVKDLDEARDLAVETEVSALLADTRDAFPQTDLDVPVVACPLPSDRRLARALGVQAFLSKPVTREDIFEAIDRLGMPLRRVLIVDDDAEMVNLLQRMLVHRILPQNCLEAPNGREALEIIRREHPDLVLLDLMMPEMDGRELIAALRSDPELAGQAVIVISALEEPATELVGELRVQPPHDFTPTQMLGLVKSVLDTLGQTS